MESATIAESGFALCDSSAVRAVSVRPLGDLPFFRALHCAGIAEAKLEDGRRVLISWGAGANKSWQFWFAHHSTHTPVWVGNDEGECELILGETFGHSPAEEWLWHGLRLQAEAHDEEWIRVPQEGR